MINANEIWSRDLKKLLVMTTIHRRIYENIL